MTYNHKKSGDRRQHKRYSIKNGAIAYFDSSSGLMGHVEDVCKKGLSFRYLKLIYDHEKPTEMNLVLPKHDFLIEKLPVNMVSNYEEVDKPTFSSVVTCRCSVQFQKLSNQQSSKLDYLIENFAAEIETP